MTGNLHITKAMVCECGNLKQHKRAVGCAECIRLDREYVASGTPSGRLRHFLSKVDWCDAFDAFEALNVDHGRNSTERDTYSQALARLVASGVVEQVKLARGGAYYRLVDRTPSTPVECVFVGEAPTPVKRTQEDRRQRRNERRRARVEAGLCRVCNAPRTGAIFCDRHSEMARANYHAHKARAA